MQDVNHINCNQEGPSNLYNIIDDVELLYNEPEFYETFSNYDNIEQTDNENNKHK